MYITLTQSLSFWCDVHVHTCTSNQIVVIIVMYGFRPKPLVATVYSYFLIEWDIKQVNCK